MSIILPESSLKKINDPLVHPQLKKLVMHCTEITDMPFVIGECCRSVAQQKINVAKGVSWTMRSRHIPGTAKCGKCCAVDLLPTVNGKVTWSWPIYYKLAPIVKKAAKDLSIAITWGGDWKKTKDGPHFELDWKVYP